MPSAGRPVELGFRTVAEWPDFKSHPPDLSFLGIKCRTCPSLASGSRVPSASPCLVRRSRAWCGGANLAALSRLNTTAWCRDCGNRWSSGNANAAYRTTNYSTPTKDPTTVADVQCGSLPRDVVGARWASTGPVGGSRISADAATQPPVAV